MKHKFLKFAAFTAATMIIINEYITTKTELLDRLDKNADAQTYKWRYGNIYYTKTGTGSPILLLHDLTPGSSAEEWKSTIETLSETHTVYAIDLLGCGRSTKPAMVYTNFLYVQQICDFITDVIQEKTEVLTSGYSGSLAVMAAHYNKEVIHSIRMINPPSTTDLTLIPGRKESIIRKILELPILGTFLYYLSTCKSAVTTLFEEKYYSNPYHVDESYKSAYYEAAHKRGCGGKYLFASLITNYIHFDIRPTLATLDIPVQITLVMDEIHSTRIEEEYKTFLPEAEYTFISSSKHYPHLENPEEFLKIFEK